MTVGQVLAWCVSAIVFLIPLNWLRLWLVGELPQSSTLYQSLIGTVVLWGFAAGLAYFGIWWGKRQKARKAKADQELQELIAQPLQEIQTTSALLKPGEKAYAAIQGTLKETKTVGYSAGTAGMSVRVAKGVTVRTGGIKGQAVKGSVSVASGELVITNQRVIFAGDRKSFAIANGNLLNTTNYSDGFGFTDGKTTHTVVTGSGKAHTIFAVVLHKVLRT